MAAKHPVFGRYSLPHGEFSVPRVVAERGDWEEINKEAVDKDGMPLPPKLHTSKGAKPSPRKRAASKPRAKKVAATPTETESSDSADTPKE